MQEHAELKLASHGSKVTKFGKPAPEIKGLVVATSLSSLITCSLEIGSRGILFAFAERWHKETSSFHLPIGEMSITLNDMCHTLISSGDHCLVACNLRLVASRYSTPIVRKSVKFWDVLGRNRSKTWNESVFSKVGCV